MVISYKRRDKWQGKIIDEIIKKVQVSFTH